MVKEKKLYIITLIFLLLPSLVIADEIGNHIHAAWTHDTKNVTGTTLIDVYSRTYNGTLTNGPTGAQDGMNPSVTNESYLYDDASNEYTNLGTGTLGGICDGTKNVSVEFMFYTDTAAAIQHAFSCEGDTDDLFGIIRYRNDYGNRMTAEFRDNGGTWRDVRSEPLQTNTWYHFVWVYDADLGMTIYMNATKGTEYNTTEPNPTVSGAAAENTIAARNLDGGAPEQELSGYMDEVRMYDYPLNQGNITWLYNSGTLRSFSEVLAETGGGAPPAAAGANFTITAESLNNGVSILDFNATVNGTFFTTSTGSINTNMSNETTEALNITIEASGFEDYERNNYNISINLKANMTSLNITLSLNVTLPTLLTGNTIQMACDYTIPNGHSLINESYTIYNLNESTQDNQDSSNYTIPTNDFLDALELSCSIETNYTKDESTNYSIAINTTNTNAEINVLGYNQVPIASGLVNITIADLELTNNPSNILLTRVLNLSNKTRTVLVETYDLQLQHANNFTYITFTENTTEYNISLIPAQLQIGFLNTNGAYVNTTGIIHDSNKTRNWSNYSLIVVQQSLELGKIQILFNAISNTNWTQYYEYENTFLTFLDVNITIITNPIKGQWYQITDYSGMPIEGATVRLYGAYPEETWQTKALYGQRLTDDEGYAFFYVDESAQGKLLVTHTNYETVTHLTLPLDDDAQTKANAKIITIKDDITSTGDTRSQLYMPNYYTNETGTIYGIINAFDYSTVELNTNYRTSLGLGRITLNNCNTLEQCYIQLIQGTDIETTPTTNITVSIWLDSTFWKNHSIILEEPSDKTELFIYDTITSNVLNPILFIGLILTTGALGFIFKNSTIGIATFNTGAIILAIFSWDYAILAFIVIIQHFLIWLKKVISE